MIVDFPTPEGPNNADFALELNYILKSFKIIYLGDLGYENQTFLNLIYPFTIYSFFLEYVSIFYFFSF